VFAGVADTHTALWYLLKNPRLSATACNFMDDAASAGYDIVLSPVSLAEIVYLVEKGRLRHRPMTSEESAQRSRIRS
jgi:PIN domain nuclease of toxin-antitoxin system